MRVFLAVDIPNKVRAELSEQLVALQKEYPYLIWVPEDNYHITLHFFGHKDKQEVEKITRAMDTLIYDIPSFRLYASYADLFINDKILLYIGFARQKILEEVEARIRAHFGGDKSKKFVPHLSIARYKIPSKQQYLLLKKKLERLEVETTFEVTEISLYESILAGKVPRYKKLATFPLEA